MHGHAQTTGVNSLDYYVSYKGFSEPQAQSHYSGRMCSLTIECVLSLNLRHSLTIRACAFAALFSLSCSLSCARARAPSSSHPLPPPSHPSTTLLPHLPPFHHFAASDSRYLCPVPLIALSPSLCLSVPLSVPLCLSVSPSLCLRRIRKAAGCRRLHASLALLRLDSAQAVVQHVL